MLLKEVKDSLAIINQGINQVAAFQSKFVSKDLEFVTTIPNAIDSIHNWIKKVDSLDDRSKILYFDNQATIQSCQEQIWNAKLYRKYIIEIDIQKSFNSFLDEHYTGLWHTDLEAIENTVQWADQVIKSPLLGSNVIPWMIGEGAESRYSALLAGLEGMKIYRDAWIEALCHFEVIGKVIPIPRLALTINQEISLDKRRPI